MQYNVYYGMYPFNTQIGAVDAPEEQPHVALAKAIKQFNQHPDYFCRHPVVEATTSHVQ